MLSFITGDTDLDLFQEDTCFSEAFSITVLSLST